jgi:hypothetical protein
LEFFEDSGDKCLVEIAGECSLSVDELAKGQSRNSMHYFLVRGSDQIS